MRRDRFRAALMAGAVATGALVALPVLAQDRPDPAGQAQGQPQAQQGGDVVQMKVEPQAYPAKPEPESKVVVPENTTPPPGASQPQAPIADQSDPAAVGPAQANTAPKLPESDIPGATRQTMPSTVSAENAEQDKLPTTAFQFPLSEEHRKLIASTVSKTAAAPAAERVEKAKVADILPGPLELKEFSGEVNKAVPEAQRYKYLVAAGQVVIVDPANRVVVGVIEM